jgi:hypothetical protein
VTKVTIFVVRYRAEHLPAIDEARRALFGDHRPADTLVGVETLAHPGCLIEVEAMAVTDSLRPGTFELPAISESCHLGATLLAISARAGQSSDS